MSKKSVVVRERVRRRATRARLELAEPVLEQLCVYIELLRRWNARMNLTALDDKETSLDRLIIEPLVAARHFAVTEGRMVDIGSGGGSPAVPLKLALPGMALLMVEAKAKKAAFLREVCRQLELGSATVETERYEALLTRPDLHEAHDVLTVRAVRVESRTLEGLQAFVKPGGHVMLFRGGGGGAVPGELRPPLVWSETYPLVDRSRSRLVVLKKQQTWRPMVAEIHTNKKRN